MTRNPDHSQEAGHELRDLDPERAGDLVHVPESGPCLLGQANAVPGVTRVIRLIDGVAFDVVLQGFLVKFVSSGRQYYPPLSSYGHLI